MRLSGQQREKLQLALIDAFRDKASLEQMLSFKLDKNLEEIASGSNLLEIVFRLIDKAESQGWVEDLVHAACKSNPGNRELQTIAQELFLPPEQSTQEHKFLLLAANYKGKSQLRLDKELREEESFVQLVELEQPEGQVPLNSLFYIERPPIEFDCYAAIMKPGALIRVKAARQMGKTSLMTRILDYGKHKGYRTVPVYFQEADGDVFNALDQLLQWFCTTIAEELKLPTGRIFESWQLRLGNKRNCTNYFQENFLSEPSSPLILGLDDVDLVFQHLQIAQDFFALLRTWHERGKNELIWQKLRLVIVHSREVYIPLNMNQSPFNVGVPIELPELTQSLVQDLAQRHGLNWQVDQTKQFMEMVGGHPYLVRMALYEIARERMTLAYFLQVAPTEEGIFSGHLRRHLENLKGSRDLSDAMKQVIAVNAPVQIDSSFSFQLCSMGLVKLKGNTIVPLCNLYRHYFHNRL